jgi:hypothetical protein
LQALFSLFNTFLRKEKDPGPKPYLDPYLGLWVRVAQKHADPDPQHCFLLPIFLRPVFLLPVFLQPVFLSLVFMLPVFLSPVLMLPGCLSTGIVCLPTKSPYHPSQSEFRQPAFLV